MVLLLRTNLPSHTPSRALTPLTTYTDRPTRGGHGFMPLTIWTLTSLPIICVLDMDDHVRLGLQQLHIRTSPMVQLLRRNLLSRTPPRFQYHQILMQTGLPLAMASCGSLF